MNQVLSICQKVIFLTSFFTLVLSNAFAQAIDALPPANNTEYPDATFEFTYSWNTPQEAKNVIEFCGDVASNYFNSSVPITVFVLWEDWGITNSFDANGSARGSSYATLISDVIDIVPDDSPFNDFWSGEIPWFNLVNVPSALSHSHSGIDHEPLLFDVTMNLNGNQNWSFSTNSLPPAGSEIRSLVTTTLHELLHGLGLSSSFSINLIDDQSTIIKPLVPNLYDTHLVVGNSSTVPLMTLDGEMLTTAVTTANNVFFEGQSAIDNNLGNRVPVYTANTWDAGTSLSHIGEFVATGQNSILNFGQEAFGICCGIGSEAPLMAASSQGSAPGIIDPIVVGIMQDIGWSMDCPNPGCSNPMACNFDWLACPNEENPSDDEDCFFGDDLYIPSVLGQEIMRNCGSAENCFNLGSSFCSQSFAGYSLADKSCLMAAIESVSIESASAFSFTWTVDLKYKYECCLNEGCGDLQACNYNINRCTTNNELCLDCNLDPDNNETFYCVNIEMQDAGMNGWQGAVWSINQPQTPEFSAFSNTLFSGAQGLESFCLREGCYEFKVTSGSNPTEISWSLNVEGIEQLSSTTSDRVGTFYFRVGSNSISVCTNPNACNYDGGCSMNPIFNGLNDINCTFPGCLNNLACNYDSDAGCHDEDLCIFLNVGAIPATDFSHPEYLTNVPWQITSFNENNSASSTIDFASDLSFSGGSNNLGDTLQTGTWSCCNSELVFFDGISQYSCDFLEFNPSEDLDGDGAFDTLIYGVIEIEDNEIGWFILEPLGLLQGCLEESACNYDSSLHIHNDGSCIYDDPDYALLSATYRTLVDLGCDGIQNQEFKLSFSDTLVQSDLIGSAEWAIGWYYTCGVNLTANGLFPDNSAAILEVELLPSGLLSTTGSIEVSEQSGCVSMMLCVSGCTNSDACNYNQAANENDGSCIMPDCTNASACNYNSQAVCSDDDMCTYVTYESYFTSREWLLEFTYSSFESFSDVISFNEDFSFFNAYGFNGGFAGTLQSCWPNVVIQGDYNWEGYVFSGQYNSIDDSFLGEVVTNNGEMTEFVLKQAIHGCRDINACNYSPEANVDDNSCQYDASQVDIIQSLWKLSYSCSSTPSDITLDFDQNLEDRSWISLNNNNGGWWSLCGYYLQLYQSETLIFEGDWDEDLNSFASIDENGQCMRITLVSEGCTDPLACNYAPEVTDEDGSCIYLVAPYCDCDSDAVFDALGVCGGGCLVDADADGICDDQDNCVGSTDACGVCNGPGPIYECGCNSIPEGYCDCEGNTLQPYCSDPAACNFYSFVEGCLIDDPSTCQYNDTDLDGICDDDDCIIENAYFVCSTCFTPYSMNENLSGGGYSSALGALAYGSLTGVEVDLLFNPSDPSISWPGDFLIEITNPQGQCVQLGGFSFGDCPASIDDYNIYPSEWGELGSVDIYHAEVIVADPFILNGEEGFWSVRIANGYLSSPEVHYQALIKLQGLCPLYQSTEILADVFCGPGTVFDVLTHQCIPITENVCPGDLDGNGIVATSDLLLFLSNFGLTCL